VFSRSEKYSDDEERKHPVPQSFSNSAIQSISKTRDKAIIPGESLRANAGSEAISTSFRQLKQTA